MSAPQRPSDDGSPRRQERPFIRGSSAWLWGVVLLILLLAAAVGLSLLLFQPH